MKIIILIFVFSLFTLNAHAAHYVIEDYGCPVSPDYLPLGTYGFVGNFSFATYTFVDPCPDGSLLGSWVDGHSGEIVFYNPDGSYSFVTLSPVDTFSYTDKTFNFSNNFWSTLPVNSVENLLSGISRKLDSITSSDDPSLPLTLQGKMSSSHYNALMALAGLSSAVVILIIWSKAF